jgi:2'-5' RNA ligase
MVRAFIAVEINEDVRKKLVTLQGMLPTSQAKLKLVEPENIHLTLKFLGEVAEEKVKAIAKAMGGAVSGFRKFNVSIKGIGVFPSLHHIRVIWAGVSEGREQIIDLQRKIDTALQPLGFRLERDFHPHATLARVKFVRERTPLVEFIKGRIAEDFGETEVQAVELKQSRLTPEGPIYTTLAKVGLA